MSPRDGLQQAKRVVVKVGTRVLVQKNGRPYRPRLEMLVRQLAALHHQGRDVVLVSSGAVGAGLEALGMKTRPTNLHDLQMAAAVGQSRLMTIYDQLFSARKCKIGQILLTADDLKHRTRHLNARNTISSLLRNRIIPVVNENDAVAVDEIKLGDNDFLAAMVALLVEADTLVLLTTADGLREPREDGRTRRISYIPKVTKAVMGLVNEDPNEFSSGGMATKLKAAQMVADMGGAAVIADGKKPDTLLKIFGGEDVGTLIGTDNPLNDKSLRARQKWIAYFHRTQGTIVIDDGAQDALERKGKSLLPIGVKDVIGEFGVGAMVEIKTEKRLVGRGLVEYSSHQIRQIKGHQTSEIRRVLGSHDYDEVIHRDNMVILNESS